MLADAVTRALMQAAHVVDIAHDGGEADRALSVIERDEEFATRATRWTFTS